MPSRSEAAGFANSCWYAGAVYRPNRVEAPSYCCPSYSSGVVTYWPYPLV
ncbi:MULTISPECIES: hypothetical protein [unclassified Streptomyces]